MRNALVVALAFVLVGCQSTPEEGPRPVETTSAPASARPEDVAQGAFLYATYCASCHGAGARGDGPAAQALVKPPPDLTLLAARHGEPLERERIAELIDGRTAHGPREMPVWGRRLYAGEREASSSDHGPSGLALESARRGTILLILDYLETLQRR
jgi:mono/diheme cytochrome c family protein